MNNVWLSIKKKSFVCGENEKHMIANMELGLKS